MLVLAVQDGDLGPGPTVFGLDRVDDRGRLVLRVRAGDELDLGSGTARRDQPLVRLVAGEVGRDQAVRDREDGLDRAEVLLDPHARWRRDAGRWVVERRALEPPVELGEGREARSPEPVDRLVVVADDHEVGGSIRRPREHLDELDLGDVRVLELVDEDVAVLTLVAAEDVRAALEELGHGGDLLTEVEGTAALELRLVGAVDHRKLAEAHDLECGAVDDVGRASSVDLGSAARR